MMGHVKAAAMLALAACAAGCKPEAAEPPWKAALDKGQVIRLAPVPERSPVLATAAAVPATDREAAEFLAAPARPAKGAPRHAN